MAISALFAFDALTIKADEHAINGLRRRPDIRYAERDGQMETIAQTLPYGIDRVDAEVAHENGATGNS
jgi:subtilisin